MVARWRQAKELKIKKARARKPKSFSMKSSGPMKQPGYLNPVLDKDNNPVIDEMTGRAKYEFVDISFGSRAKAAQSSPNWDTLSRFLMSHFKPNDHEAVYARTRGLHTDLTSHVKHVSKRKAQPVDQEVILVKQIQSKLNAGSIQGESKYVQHKMSTDSPNWDVRLFISGDDCFFVSEMRTETEMVYKVSADFIGIHNAIHAFKKDRVIWRTVLRTPLS